MNWYLLIQPNLIAVYIFWRFWCAHNDRIYWRAKARAWKKAASMYRARAKSYREDAHFLNHELEAREDESI